MVSIAAISTSCCPENVSETVERSAVLATPVGDRIVWLRTFAVLAILSILSAHALAQEAVPSDKPVTAKAKRVKPHKAAARAAEATKPQAPEPWRAVDPSRVARPATEAGTAPVGATGVEAHRRPVDPIEFGGKWSGNNDTAEKTRVQNYNGDAFGTGGEVGLKLHF